MVMWVLKSCTLKLFRLLSCCYLDTNALQQYVEMHKWAEFKYLVHVDGLGLSSRCAEQTTP